jgi:AraC-like DNA-binding protein
MAELMRVAALTGYFQTMAEFGVDPRPLLRRVGLSHQQLADPEQLISARAAIRLLEFSAAETGCITLGLRMAEGRSVAHFGATSLLIAHQPTLRMALDAIREFRNRINSTLVLDVTEHEGEVIVREELTLSSPEPSRQASNLAIGTIARLCAGMLGDGWAPLGVCFAHDAPPAAELPIFRRLFRCRPEFGSPINGLVLDPADLDRVNPRADGGMAQHARQLIETTMSRAARTAAQDVEHFIMLSLSSGRASIQNCADSMGMTVRSLQRMLDAEETSFSDLLNRVRMQLAAQYLSNPRVRITDVADILGYGSIGAFTRWHVQTVGQSPREWRSARRAGKSLN